jgi:hypothetical protein
VEAPNITRRRLDVQNRRREVEEFFAGYEARVNAALGEPPLVDVEAHPSGVTHFEKEQFRAAIPQVFERQRSIGSKSMRMVSLEVTPVDDHHWAGKVRWEARYERGHRGCACRVRRDIPRPVGRRTTADLRLHRGDEEGFLKEKGLIPN